MNLIVVGVQWGDEGKGKIVDILSEAADYIVRYQGGHNAGHTVVVDQDPIVLHLLPTGVLRSGKVGVIGHGVVVDPVALLDEIRLLAQRGISVAGRLFVSEAAHLILPYHRAIDRESERVKGARKIGTTGRGIGPAYADKAARIGIRVMDLMEPETFREKLGRNLSEMNPLLASLGATQLDCDQVCKAYLDHADLIRPYVADTSRMLHQAIAEGRHVLFEGAQGTHLDVDLGTYPYVTSSSAGAGGACTGTGVGPTQIDAVLGVAKAYTTRVGGGPFPSEITGDAGALLRVKGNEFGATTGRPRRCGWFDAVLARYAVRVNSLASLAITKLDVLSDLPEIQVCVGYRFEGRVYEEMPASLRVLEGCEPILESCPGWQTPIAGVTSYDQLPHHAKRYLEFLAETVGCRIDIVSTGSQRGEVCMRRHPFHAAEGLTHRT